MTAVSLDAAAARTTRIVPLALTLVVVVSTVARVFLSQSVSVPWIVPDEIIYSELAKSIAAGNLPAVRGSVTSAFGPIYPLLISPGWVIADDPAKAYRIALGINAFVMSLAALPAYGLARMFVSRWKAVLVAGFAVGVPSMAYTDVLMTENAFYPAFLLGVFGITRAVRRPSLSNQTFALASIGLLCLVRIQGVALVVGYLGAIVLGAFVSPPRGGRLARLRPYRPSAVVLLAAAMLAPAVAAFSGTGLLGWLGIYSGAFGSIHLLEIPRWLVLHVANLSLYSAVAPMAATVVLISLGLRRRATERVRCFAVVMLPVCLSVLVTVVMVSASIDVDGNEVLNERYLFYLVPLLLLGLALWIEEGLPRPRVLAPLVAFACAVLPAVIPFNDLSYNVNYQALALVPWVLLEEPAVTTGLVVGAVCLGCALLWFRVRADRVGRLWIAVTWSFIFVGGVGVAAMAAASNISNDLGVGRETNWIDAAVPRGAVVTVVWRDAAADDPFGALASRVVMLNEFFNRSVGEVVNVGHSTPTDGWLPTREVRRQADGLVTGEGGVAVKPTYVLALCTLGVDGREIERDNRTGAVLYRLTRPLRVNAFDVPCEGLYGNRFRAYQR